MHGSFVAAWDATIALGGVMETGLHSERGKHWYECHCGWVSRLCESADDAENAWMLHVRQSAARDALAKVGRG